MKKVAIIGGGISGLAAGIYGQQYGLECEIFEKQPHAGGNLTGWQRQGCVIDNCIHWLTGTLPGNPTNDIWRELGMLDDTTQLHRGAHLYESRWNGKTLALSANPEETRRQMLALSPNDAPEINRFIRTVQALIPIVGSSRPVEKAGILPHLPAILHYWKTSLFDLAARFRHPLLRLAMTDYIGGEFSSMALLCAYAAFVSGNGSVPVGGSIEAAKRIQNRFTGLGGVFHGGTPIREIVTENGIATGVLTEDGRFYPSDHVICACDPEVTFGQLLPPEWMPKQLKKRLSDPNAPVFSSIHAAFLCDRDALKPFCTCIIDSPSFSIRSDGRLPVKEYSHEPGYAPAGKVLLQTLVFQTEDECREWLALRNDPAAYNNRKQAISAQMFKAIIRAMPELKDSLEPVDFWTPATYHRYFGARSGAYLSGALTPQASLKRLSNRVPRLRNVTLATQWLQSPGGLPIAAMSGIAAAKSCKQKVLRAQRTKSIVPPLPEVASQVQPKEE